jgi:hypothetical protein
MCAVADDSAKSSGVSDRELEEEKTMLCRFIE